MYVKKCSYIIVKEKVNFLLWVIQQGDFVQKFLQERCWSLN